MTRLQSFDFEVKDLIRAMNRISMPDVKLLQAEICFDFANEDYTWGWTEMFNIPSGLQKQKIKELGFEICLKRDATFYIRIGEFKDSAWLKKPNHYWLRPTPSQETSA